MSSQPLNETAVQVRRIRRAARILLMDEQDRVLLIRFVPADRRPFWCGVGGECDADEDFAAAAVREIFEETGLKVAGCGPEVARRADDFITLEGEPVTSDERFFRVQTQCFTPDTSGHSATERAMIKEFRWFTREELAAWHEPVFPRDLIDLISADSAR